jgi:Glycosyl transferase family 11
VSLSGGVGNQLFQYAAGRTIAAERGVALQVSARPAQGSRSLGIRDLLDVPKAIFTRHERFLGGFPDAPLAGAPVFLKRAARSVDRRATRYHVVRQTLLEMADPKPEFDPRYRYLHLRGFFQHPSYYERVLDEIVGEMSRKLGPTLDFDSGAGVVAMHFRRGDYLLYGYDLPFSFHEGALSVITRSCPVSRVLVMSDDSDFAALAAEHFEREGLPAEAVSGGTARSDLDDFRTLTTAQHVVMSNSTFVWWAAVLGDRIRGVNGSSVDRTVVCPAPWMPRRAAETLPADRLDLSRPGWVLHSIQP